MSARFTDPAVKRSCGGRESELLACLARRRGNTVTYAELVAAGWGGAADVKRNTLHQVIYLLRSRLQDFGLDRRLTSVRDRGYRYSPS